MADGFVAHINAALVQQVFDIPQLKRKSNVQLHRKLDDLGTGFAVIERGGFRYTKKVKQLPCSTQANLI